MKLLYKATCAAVIASTCMSPIVASFAFAEGNAQGENQGQHTLGNPENFCASIGTITSTIEDRMNEKSTKLDQKRDDRVSQWETKKAERDARLEDKRGAHDVKRDERFGFLRQKATTPEQTQAVDDFESAVTSLVDTRRHAVDDAIEGFRSDVDGLLDQKFNATDTAVIAYKAAVTTALEKAKSDCANGVAQATVRTNLKNDIQAAREAFKASHEEVKNIKEDIHVLAETRKESVQRAFSTFRSGFEQARNALKAFFGFGNTSTQE